MAWGMCRIFRRRPTVKRSASGSSSAPVPSQPRVAAAVPAPAIHCKIKGCRGPLLALISSHPTGSPPAFACIIEALAGPSRLPCFTADHGAGKEKKKSFSRIHGRSVEPMRRGSEYSDDIITKQCNSEHLLHPGVLKHNGAPWQCGFSGHERKDCIVMGLPFHTFPHHNKVDLTQ